jgi:tetratricopeptide (TPR) repeat protein
MKDASRPRERSRTPVDRSWRIPAAILVALLAAIIAYLPALRAPFELDDFASIPGNATIRTLAPAVALDPPPNTTVAGRPAVNYSLALNYAVNRWLGVAQAPEVAAQAEPNATNETLGYHVGNIALHLLCGLLLFGVIRRTARFAFAESAAARADGLATAVTMLWLLAPVQSEAVNYLIQRTELLVSLCYLAVLYGWIRAWEAADARRVFAWRAAAVAAMALGIASKEVMLTAPAVVILYDRAFRVDTWRGLLAGRRRIVFYSILIALSAVAVVAAAVSARAGTVGFELGVSWYAYLYTQAWAITHYLGLALWPDRLTFDYGQRPIGGMSGVPGAIFLVAFFAATIAAWFRARWRWFAFLGSAFFLILAPSSSIVPIVTEIAAERRIYLALAPMLVLAGIGVVAAAQRFQTTSAHRRAWTIGVMSSVAVAYVALSGWGVTHWIPQSIALRWVTRLAIGAGAAALAWLFVRGRPRVAIVVVALLCTGATFARGRTYANRERLWRDTVRKAPNNPRAYDNLAATLFFSRPPQLFEAKELYWKAIALDPQYLPAWPGLASVALAQGKPDEAEWALQQALAADSTYTDAISRLGTLYLHTGHADRAIPYLQRIANAYPDDSSLITLGGALLQTGRLDEAERALRAALSIDPDRPDALRNLGGLLIERGQYANAVPLLERVLQRGSGSAIDAGLLSVAYAGAGRSADAIGLARRVAGTAAGNATVLVLAGRALLLVHDASAAEQYLNDAVRLDPRNPEALTRLGDANAALGRNAEARALFTRALGVDSTYAPAAEGLRRVR